MRLMDDPDNGVRLFYGWGYNASSLYSFYSLPHLSEAIGREYRYYRGHFGKADPDYQGLGFYMACETAKRMAQVGCHYLNYEKISRIRVCAPIKRRCSPSAF